MRQWRPDLAVGVQTRQLGLGQHVTSLSPRSAALLLGHAAHAVAALAERELELDLGLHRGVGVVAAHLARAALAARGVAVQRVGDAVEDGRLAGAGGAGDQEQRAGGQAGEIHLLAPGEGAEGLQRELERLHAWRSSFQADDAFQRRQRIERHAGGFLVKAGKQVGDAHATVVAVNARGRVR